MNTKVDESKLISGKDALIALENGEEVEFKCGGMSWSNLDAKQQPLEILIDKNVVFRLKPRTISINGIEVPAPYLPEEDEVFYHVSPEYEKGYAASTAREGNETTWQQFGAWRTDGEVKQVVAALRQVFGGSHDN